MTAKPVTLTPAQSACLWQLNRFGESAQHAAVKQLENKGSTTNEVRGVTCVRV